MSFIYNYIEINEEKLKVGVYCPAFNCSPEYLEYNKKVFDHFGININYINSGETHAKILTTLSREEDVDYLCFVDVDAIPLSPDILETFIGRLYNKNAIIGIEQTSNNHSNEIDKQIALRHALSKGENISNHISPSGNINNLTNDDPSYAGPAFFVISKKTYTLLGEPSYAETYRSDCGEELSYIAREKGFEVKYISFSTCIHPMWRLKNNVKFGIGSTYENLVYHNFQARCSTSLNMFVNRCKEVISTK